MTGPAPTGDNELLLEQRPEHAGPTFATFYARHEAIVLAYFQRRVRAPLPRPARRLGDRVALRHRGPRPLPQHPAPTGRGSRSTAPRPRAAGGRRRAGSRPRTADRTPR